MNNLMMPGISAPRLKMPWVRGFVNNNSGDPTITAHRAGSLLIAGGMQITTDTEPSLPAPWVRWFGITGNTMGMVMYSLRATASNHTAVWTGATGSRPAWVIEDGEIDKHSEYNGTGTSLVANTIADLDPYSLLLLFAATRADQVAIGTAFSSASGFSIPPWDQLVAFNTTGASRYVAHTAPDTLPGFAIPQSTFPAVAGTYDTTTQGNSCLVGSIKPLRH